MDFVKVNLVADSSDEEDGSLRNSQPTSEASEEFTPTAHAIKVNLHPETNGVRKLRFGIL